MTWIPQNHDPRSARQAPSSGSDQGAYYGTGHDGIPAADDKPGPDGLVGLASVASGAEFSARVASSALNVPRPLPTDLPEMAVTPDVRA